MENKVLKVGDKVWWRAGYGNRPAEVATVIRVTRAWEAGEKYGEDVDELPWEEVEYFAVVDLDNGHWAYGTQLSPYTDD